MKKISLMALTLVLVGAGCLGGGGEVSNIEDNSGSPTMAVPAPGHEGTPEMIVNDGISDPEVGIEIIGDGEVEVVNIEVSADLPIKKVSMKSGNFFFEPASIAVQAGQTVEITFSENSGFHTFVIDEIGLKESIKEGGVITFTAPAKGGTYEFYCDIGNHRAQGMFGSFHVKEL